MFRPQFLAIFRGLASSSMYTAHVVTYVEDIDVNTTVSQSSTQAAYVDKAAGFLKMSKNGGRNKSKQLLIRTFCDNLVINILHIRAHENS
jgi:hypothetical protein